MLVFQETFRVAFHYRKDLNETIKMLHPVLYFPQFCFYLGCEKDLNFAIKYLVTLSYILCKLLIFFRCTS